MRRIYFYLLMNLAFISRFVGEKWYMRLVIAAYRSQGVVFEGRPEYIQQDAHLDASGGLTICKNVVISTKVVILTHDWSFLKRAKYMNANTPPLEIEQAAFRSVRIGENSFIGAGAIVLPGTVIGKNCIIGAGAVIKGSVEDYSIMAGNPAKKIGETR